MPHTNQPPRILYCHCTNAGVLPAATRDAVLGELCDSGLPFEAVADLCELSARRDPLLKRLAAAGPLIIAACHPRTVRCLFAAADAPLSQESAQLLNLRTEGAELSCAAIREISRAQNRQNGASKDDFETVKAGLESAAVPSGGWNPWAPVIDYECCTGCMQCLSFCLFGVYAVDQGGKIEVRNPTQCKNNCPACSRVCPEAAILFPKHIADAINGGASGGGVTREAIKVDISALLGGNLHSILRERSGPRFSKDRDPDMAIQERRKYLAALAQTGDIPPEVFNNLPPPEEIVRLSAEANAKGRAALEAKST